MTISFGCLRTLGTLVLSLLLLAGCGGDPPAVQPALEGDLSVQLEQMLDLCVQGQAGNPLARQVPGAVLLVDTPEGRYLKARGVADLGSGRPLRADDRLQIGSNTKMFTGVLLLRLEEQGKLSLEDPLSRWLPELAARLPHGEKITLRQLATHTSGIWDYADAIIGGGLQDPALMRKGYTPQELVEYAIDRGKPDFEPGAETEWKYSNTGYILLGMVIEKAGGAAYAAQLEDHIFKPLGMNSATLEPGSPAPDTPVRGYYDHAKGTDATPWNLSQGWAAGAIVCTAEDLARFGHALLEGTLFEKPETTARMRDYVTGRVGLASALCLGYGIGLQQLALHACGHRGQTLGFSSILMVFPEQDIVAVALTNDAIGPDMLVQGKLSEIFAPLPEPAASK